jgi:hypothetical protein
MIKKYSALIIFTAIEISLALLSLNDFIKNDSDLLSVLTGLFLIATPALYYVSTSKKQTEFTFWFVFYSVFKITPYIFSMKNNFFEALFQWKIYFNIAFLIFLIVKVFQLINNFRKSVKQKNNIEKDEYSIISYYLKKAIKFKKLAKMIAFEVCSFYYCFIKWKGNKTNENSFSGFRESGVSAVYIGLMLVSVFEAIGVHLFLIARNKTAAIVFLILHAYLLINLIGHLKAIYFRSHLVLSQKIIIRYGLFKTLKIPIDSIVSVQKFEGDYEKSNDLVKFALLGKLEPHNILIELKENKKVALPFGITKKPKKILVYIDNANAFIKMVNDNVELLKSVSSTTLKTEKACEID